jgi:hypothetical protein
LQTSKHRPKGRCRGKGKSPAVHRLHDININKVQVCLLAHAPRPGSQLADGKDGGRLSILGGAVLGPPVGGAAARFLQLQQRFSPALRQLQSRTAPLARVASLKLLPEPPGPLGQGAQIPVVSLGGRPVRMNRSLGDKRELDAVESGILPLQPLELKVSCGRRPLPQAGNILFRATGSKASGGCQAGTACSCATLTPQAKDPPGSLS